MTVRTIDELRDAIADLPGHLPVVIVGEGLIEAWEVALLAPVVVNPRWPGKDEKPAFWLYGAD